MLNEISIDQNLLDNGVWTYLRLSKLKIASVESKAFKEALFELEQPYLTADEYIALLAKYILLDWLDIKNPKGDDLSYSIEIAATALATNESLLTFVDEFSRSLKNYVSRS